jgi:uncharacterized small protein (DUF1192 family)
VGPHELREKYAELRALRMDRSGADPRPRLRALATRFPGALRELDVLSIDTIDERIALLARAEEDPAAEELWMRVAAAFHVAMREALAVKRARAGTKARAPSGRLSDEVWDDLGRAFGRPADELRALVFGRVRSG